MNAAPSIPFDVIIIGAGPAGSSAAILASRLGWRVLLLDQQQFPRRKICGGCISAAGTRRLKGLLQNSPLPGVPERRVSFFTLTGRRLIYRADGQGRVVDRSELDMALVNEAQRQGAMVLQASRAIPVQFQNSWSVRTRDDVYASKVVLLATGLNGARCLNACQEMNRIPSGIDAAAPRAMVGWQWVQPMIPNDLEIGDVELHWLNGGYVGLARTRADECNVAIAVGMDLLRSPSSDDPSGNAFRRSIKHLQRTNPDSRVWSKLESETKVTFQGKENRCHEVDSIASDTTKGVAGFPVRPPSLSDGNLLRIGDSAGYSEPFTGDGMNLAMLSAELAIRACRQAGMDHLARFLNAAELGAGYARTMARYHLPRIQRTRLIGTILRQDWIRRLDGAIPHGWPTAALSQLLGWVHAGRGAK